MVVHVTENLGLPLQLFTFLDVSGVPLTYKMVAFYDCNIVRCVQIIHFTELFKEDLPCCYKHVKMPLLQALLKLY